MPKLAFLNEGFQSVAKTTSGSQTKLRYASLKAVLLEEEKRNNGSCRYREMLQHVGEKLPIYYCDVTHYPAQYTDATTGLRYADASCFQYIRQLERSQVMQLQDLRRLVNMDEKLGFQ